MFSRFKKYCSHLLRQRRMLLIVGSLLALALPAVALAQVNPASISPGTDSGLSSVLLPVLDFLRRFLWPFLLLIGNLLQNDLLFGGSMEERLLLIWTNVRDIVNIFFVLVLVGIAVYNVVGGFKEDYHIKTVLPKLIIGLIVVNFTFTGVKVVLDGINVITTGIFALPSATQVALDSDFQKRFCNAIYNPDGKGYKIPDDATNGGKTAFCDKDQQIVQGDPELRTWFNGINRRNAAIVLALNFEKIDLINQIATNTQDLQNSTLFVNALFSIILYIIYASSFIALFVVLLVRLVILWLMVVLSPLMVLMYVLPEKVKSMISTGEDVAQQFIKHALVPIPVALYMSIGIILLNGLQNIKFPSTTLNANTLGLNFLTSGISTLQDLIIAVAAVAFVWKGVFDAMKDTYASSITGGIQDFVKNSGMAIAKLPLSAPIFPFGTGGKASVLELLRVAKRVPQLVDNKVDQQVERDFGSLFHGAEGLANNIKSATSIAKVKELATHDPLNRNDISTQKAVAEYLKHHSNEAAKLKYPGQYAGNAAAFIKALESEKGIDKFQMEDFWNKNDVSPATGAPVAPAGPPPPGKTGATPNGTAAATAASAAAWYDNQATVDAMKNAEVSDDQIDALKNQSKFDKDLKPEDKAALKQLDDTLKNPKTTKDQLEKTLKDPKVKAALQKLGDQKQAQAQQAKTAEEDMEKYLKVRDDAGISDEERVKQLDEIVGKELGDANLDATTPDGKKKAQEALDRVQNFGKKFSADQIENFKKVPGFEKTKLSKVIEHANPSQPAAPGKPAPSSPPKPAGGTSGAAPAGTAGTPPAKP